MSNVIPRSEYPRPHFKRDDQSWICLNGTWQFDFDDRKIGEEEGWFLASKLTKTINVPFCYQSELSGIYDKTRHDIVWYQREVELPEGFNGKRILLHFGAVDFKTTVWVNGQRVGEHVGGYSPFIFDVTHYLNEGCNSITVRAEDSATTAQPRGKQSWKEENFGCWYTAVTGIWQPVWLEAVSSDYIENVKITTDIDTYSVRIDALLNTVVENGQLKATVAFDGEIISEQVITLSNRTASMEMEIKSDRFHWKQLLWTPEEPNLYDIDFELLVEGECIDFVSSYFGMRKISTKQGKVMLNNQPYYQKLVLDQGYFDGGLLTAAKDEDFVRDIRFMKEFGFNGVRKHQKAEDPRFLYWTDKLGLLVWGEMGSPYEFTDEMTAINMEEWRRVAERDYNHPSIIAWTLMNESWGIPQVLTDAKQQHHTMALYHMVKSYDQTRLVISNDGWEHTDSDLVTFHDYTQDGAVLEKKLHDLNAILEEPVCSIGNALGAKYLFAEGHEYTGQPILLSECCGIAYETEGGWGYGKSVKTEEDFLDRYEKIISAIHRTPYIMGYCATQLTDVEQEVNGLLTIDRKPKIDPTAFSKIIKREI
jgi:beta-galactosidase/beta-glucuronidase